MRMNKGSLIIISGPSGSGKDTVLKKLFEKMPEIEFSISSVSRPMREGEIQGEKYNFITPEQFEQMIVDDALLEYNVYCGNYYGTPKAPVERCIASGGEIILEVDVNGAANVRKNCPDNFSVFIAPPSFEVLRNRLVNRGTETSDVIEKRLNQAKNELDRAKEYDYIVVNDNLDEAVEELKYIILSERHRIDRNGDILEKL
ncbi:MAG: guanylate kinase [Clostridia bacterium]|nr:guanylate kinase [Clostridia bacterium]